MACPLSFAFITDNCRWDNGELRTALEDLCDLANEPIVPLDPNAGGCGEWGPDSTLVDVSYNPATHELTVDAVPEWTSLLFSDFASATYAPTDISAVALYPGVTLAVNIVNPSACRSLVVSGILATTNVITYTRSKHIIAELRDVTGGAPGVVVGDKQRLLTGYTAGSTFFDEVVVQVAFTTTIAPSGSFSATYQSYINTIATGAGTASLWHQTSLSIAGIGSLV